MSTPVAAFGIATRSKQSKHVGENTDQQERQEDERADRPQGLFAYQPLHEGAKRRPNSCDRFCGLGRLPVRISVRAAPVRWAGFTGNSTFLAKVADPTRGRRLNWDRCALLLERYRLPGAARDSAHLRSEVSDLRNRVRQSR